MRMLGVIVSIVLIGNASVLLAQLDKPRVSSPKGPSQQSPTYSWTKVEGATQYKVTVNAPTQICCGNGGCTQIHSGEIASIVDAGPRCTHSTCGFRFVAYQGLPEGVHSYLPQFHCPRDQQGKPYIFTLSVQALSGSTSGPESELASYWLNDTPPSTSTPPPAPPQDSYVLNCVFKTGNNFWGWYDGVFGPFVNSAGQVAPNIIGKAFTFAPAPFENCNGIVGGAIPVGATKFVVNNVALCSNLISGAQETFVNSTCPTGDASPFSYAPILVGGLEPNASRGLEHNALQGIKRIEFDGSKSGANGCADPANPSNLKPVGSTYCLNPTGNQNEGDLFQCNSDGFWWNIHQKCTF